MSSDTGPDKPYYSIGEVCKLTGLEDHVLRYWETQFPSLRPIRNRAGNRVYRPKDLEHVRQLRHLLHERQYTIAGAKRRIEESRKAGVSVSGEEEAEAAKLLAEVREGLERVRELLTLPPVEPPA